MQRLSIEFTLDCLLDLVAGVESLDYQSLEEFSNHLQLPVHVAVMREPYLSYVLEGKKTIESRLTKHRIKPYESVAPGDIILFKESSGPVRGIAEASAVRFLQPGSFDDLEAMESEFGYGLSYDSGFLVTKQEARYVTLVFLKDVRPTPPLSLVKRDRQTWLRFSPSLFGSDLADWAL